MLAKVLPGLVLVLFFQPLAWGQPEETWGSPALQQRIQDGPVEVPLAPDQGTVRTLGWGPKGTSFPLQPEPDANDGRLILSGTFAVGDQATIKVRLTIPDAHREEADRADAMTGPATLEVDFNGNGKFEPKETSSITPSRNRGKVWYSGEGRLLLPASEGEANPTRDYPIALWYVEDPDDPEAAPIMRWSRRGWHAGIAQVGKEALVLVVSDTNADGRFTEVDAWGLQPAADPSFSVKNSAFKVASHAWLGEIPYRIKSLDPYGRSAVIEAFDLGRTRAEDEAAGDPAAADRKLPRARVPVTFLTNHDKALATAQEQDRLILVDFVTTWCGPCRVMDQVVYTAAPTADTCRQVVCLKLDGDEEKELVKRYEVSSYPTLLLLSPTGEVLGRRTGYQSVSKLVSWIDTTVQAAGRAGRQVPADKGGN